jgi:hypothetical protein
MKKILFGLIIFYAFILTSFAQNTQLLFKGKNQYLGQIEDNALPVTLSFYYVNKSKTNIRIVSVKCSDETKVTDWNKNQTIAAGKSGKISFSYNGNRLGVFNQKILIKTNEPNTKETELVFGGEVIPRKKTSADIYANNNGVISFASNIINFGEIKNTQKKTDSLFFINNSNKTLTIEDYELNPSFAKIVIVTNDILPKAKGKIIVVYNATLRNAYGKTTDTIYFKSNEENNSLKEIYLQADIYEDFSKIKPEKLKLAPKAYLINTNYDFKYVKKGEDVKTVFNIKNKGKTQLLIRKVDKTCDCITVNYPEKIRFDRDSPIGISMNTQGLKGNIHETVTIITNDPENPRIVLHLMGIVD